MCSEDIYDICIHIIDRKTARSIGTQFYFTGKECKYGHISPRYVSTKICVKCAEVYHKKYNSQNKTKLAQKKKNYYEKNKEAITNQQQSYRKENKDKAYSVTANYRASKLQRTLSLPNINEQIQCIYSEAGTLRSNGYNVHVDHIIPLQGESISGLHVPWNLQIISAEDNLSKSNKFESYVEVYQVAPKTESP